MRLKIRAHSVYLIFVIALGLQACGGGGGSQKSPPVTPEPTVGVSIIFSDTTFSENNGNGSFTVKLNTEPNNDVIIDIVSENTSVSSIDKSQITFDVDNWDIEQTISLSGIDDTIADGNKVFTINLSINSLTIDTTGYADLTADQVPNVSVTVIDDDAPGVTITPLQLSVSEKNGEDTFDIVLNTQPNGTVIINLSNDNTAAATLAVSQVTFDSTSWNVSKSTTISGIDDALSSGNKTARINFDVDASSTDTTGYNSVNAISEVQVTVVDNDVPITLFNAGITNGNMGGRAGADAKCAAAAPAIQACTNKNNVHAFLSSNASDQIKDMPTNYSFSSTVPIQGPTGTVISNTWADLFTYNSLSEPFIQQSLASAGVLPANKNWWSGSRYAGNTYNTVSHCVSWTSSGTGTFDKSFIGSSSNTDIRWILDGVWNTPSNYIPNESFVCSNTIYLLCSCGA